MNNQRYPSLYEINTRVWIRQFDGPDRLSNIPNDYWEYLKSRGVQYIWMMGVWQTVSREQLLVYALEPGLQQAYRYALPDWTKTDVIGSPYAIDQYQPAAELGNWDDLAKLRAQLHQRGMQLILDFVPNHFHAESKLIDEQPFLFLPGTEELLHTDPATFYRHNDQIWAHGRDPYFPAWQDTIQVNYFDNQARDFMSDQLLRLAEVCDGVRCDMAMLMLNTVFESTWRHTSGFIDRNTEFWERTIKRIKQQFPDFLFIAEAYWDLEYQLQQLGFDYTYDKRLLDRLHEGNVPSIRGHLSAEPDFSNKLVRFLENHDEDRILNRVNAKQAEAAALITYTLPGMRFFYDGQWEGKRVRLPVQLGREPQEFSCTCVQASYLHPSQAFDWMQLVCKCNYVFYEKLTTLLKRPILQEGYWQQLEMETNGASLLAWRWQLAEEYLVVIVNYTNQAVEGHWPTLLEEKGVLLISEPWCALSYEVEASEPRTLKMYPFEYRILTFSTPQ